MLFAVCRLLLLLVHEVLFLLNESPALLLLLAMCWLLLLLVQGLLLLLDDEGPSLFITQGLQDST